MKKNDHIIGVCSDLTSSALGVCKVERFPLFITNFLPDEEAEIRVVKVLSKYGFGKIEKLIKQSEHRIEPLCSKANQCGGCQLMMLSYDQQLKYKQEQVKKALGSIEPLEFRWILGCKNKVGFRNKVMIPVEHNSFKSGFYRVHSHSIVDTDWCCIQSDRMNVLYQKIRELIQNESLTQVQTIIMREGINTKHIMIAFAVKGRVSTKQKEKIVSILSQNQEVKSILLNYHKEASNTVLSKENELLYGKETIQEQLLGLTFNISLNSFFQVNTTQTETLYQCAIDLAQLKKTDRVLDLYCGVGSIALCIAKRVKEVVGVEIVEEAVRNANQNKQFNNIDNARFICQDASDFVRENKIEFDVVMVDPPRKGLTEEGINHLLRIGSQKIVYISCNPITLGRDLQRLSQEYRVDIVQPVDMFPQTSHVECVVLMSRVAPTK